MFRFQIYIIILTSTVPPWLSHSGSDIFCSEQRFHCFDSICQSLPRKSCFHMLSLIISNLPPHIIVSLFKVLSHRLVCIYAELSFLHFFSISYIFCFCFLFECVISCISSYPFPVTPDGHNHESNDKKLLLLSGVIYFASMTSTSVSIRYKSIMLGGIGFKAVCVPLSTRNRYSRP